jgi:outer membrane protein OmpA-like peptidoglycan-associated protein
MKLPRKLQGRALPLAGALAALLVLGGCVSRSYDWVRVGDPARAQAPAPVVIPPPPPPQVVKSAKLGADGLFRFAGGQESDLLPQGRQRIEALIEEIRRDVARVDSITITGHTDWIGTASSNDVLSLQRAQTVRNMFVRSAGVEPSLIQAVGAGENYPVVQCEGTRVTPALVSCLQPNRRVEIAVMGALR